MAAGTRSGAATEPRAGVHSFGNHRGSYLSQAPQLIEAQDFYSCI